MPTPPPFISFLNSVPPFLILLQLIHLTYFSKPSHFKLEVLVIMQLQLKEDLMVFIIKEFVQHLAILSFKSLSLILLLQNMKVQSPSLYATIILPLSINFYYAVHNDNSILAIF